MERLGPDTYGNVLEATDEVILHLLHVATAPDGLF